MYIYNIDIASVVQLFSLKIVYYERILPGGQCRSK